MAEVRMRLVQATDDDNDRLLEFFTQNEMPGQVRLKVRRMFSFFNQYRNQSDDFVTYLLLNANDEIEAMASIIFREGFVDGVHQTIGYATDLRVSPTRTAITSWSQHFLPVLETEKQKRNCQYIFSVVAHNQRQAYNAFIRPRGVRRKMPRYHLFRKFSVVTLHGLWPFHTKPISGIAVRSARESDFDQLSEYIVKQFQNRPLHYVNSAEDFRKSIERWRDLYLESFLVALDRKGTIIGTVAPWSPQRVQRSYVTNYDARAQNLRDFLKLFSMTGITHPLPKVGDELEMRHLTHLFADNPDIFYALLYNAFRQSGKNEFLAYPHFEGELLTLPPRPFVAAENHFGLYCILSPTDSLPDFLKPRPLSSSPTLETAHI